MNRFLSLAALIEAATGLALLAVPSVVVLLQAKRKPDQTRTTPQEGKAL